jgi:hypothetical protein
MNDRDPETVAMEIEEEKNRLNDVTRVTDDSEEMS